MGIPYTEVGGISTNTSCDLSELRQTWGVTVTDRASFPAPHSQPVVLSYSRHHHSGAQFAKLITTVQVSKLIQGIHSSLTLTFPDFL